MADPCLIKFPKLGNPAEGFISIAEHAQIIPFPVQRTFWTYYTPESIVRGRHAHYRTEQVLLAVSGRILVTVEQVNQETQLFKLEDPHVGLYIPPNVWHTMQYSHSAVQLVFASQPYDEQDYIRNYDEFKRVWSTES